MNKLSNKLSDFIHKHKDKSSFFIILSIIVTVLIIALVMLAFYIIAVIDPMIFFWIAIGYFFVILFKALFVLVYIKIEKFFDDFH